MKVIIIGAGVVGTSLAKKLSADGHQVVVIAQEASVVKHVQESMDVQVLQGDPADGSLLQSAGLLEAELILAVTDSDENNIITTLMAQAYNPQAKIIARVHKKQFMENPIIAKGMTLGGTMVFSPEHAAVEMVLDLLQVDHAFEVVPFKHGMVRIAGFHLGPESALLGRTLQECGLAKHGALVVAVDKGGEVVIPTGRTILQATDRVLLTSEAQCGFVQILPLLGRTPVQHRKIVIAGGGWKGEQVAREIEKRGIPVVILEKSLSRCQELAEMLDNTDVIHCDATDPATIRHMAKRASTLIGMTGQQEVNLVLCLLARQGGASRTIALMDNEAYLTLAPSLGIDAVVSPKLAAVGKIMRFLSRGKVIDAATAFNGQLDAVFVEVEAHCRIVGLPLKDLGLPKALLVAAVVRNGKMHIPKGDFVFSAGDQALIITSAGHLQQIDDFLRAA
ncbi:Trk system potassium transporter TrkA [Candidatus Magnetaquicoccus inordinatus]|uniref:Trk system potassium transporter TrkA n=1 Tax=Candidatus Magnetaquicoccus inordinatus TaxID=2496818 RepID=UPI00102AEA93|nr:Trk system potassium transporter TrkA [Candidatus Magnetaquicoccus inordinatus]